MNDQDEEAIFAAAIEIESPDQRAQYLKQACAGNPSMLASIEQLISMHDTDRDFLETPAVASAVGTQEEQSGQLIDRYRLIRPIGEGGFGVVWEATQQQPVRRPVAMKIIRAEVATERFVSRFERERQTLALMNHPNIATVFDAGTTPGGHPYFVMELVDGESIDQYAEQHGLSAKQRINLLIEVCSAVHHAHQKGIVHRDLKPTNVMVAEIDGGPCIKMIDFGIAKALRGEPEGADPNLTTIPELSTNHTADHSVAGTPHFMSPEQFQGNADIDTVADVYALGGIAYHLMTGVAPYETEQRQSVHQLRDLICGEQLPIKPSDRAQLPKGVRESDLEGDIDAIVLKAISKDRENRYQSAGELAGDLQRFLEDQPVSAVNGNAAYVLRKFARRYRVAALAATLAILSLVVGATGITVAFFRAQAAQESAERARTTAETEREVAEEERAEAERMREIAETESNNAKQLATLLQEMLGASDPERGLPSNFTLRQQIDVFAAKLKGREELVSSPEVRADLHRTLGRSYLALRSLKEADLHLREALSIRQSLYPTDDPRVLESRLDHAQYLLFSQKPRRLQQELNRLIPVLRDKGPKKLLVQALIFAGSTQGTGNRVDALRMAREALTAARDVHGPSHWVTLVQQSRVALQTAILSGPETDGHATLEAHAIDALAKLESEWPDHEVEIAICRSHVARVLYAGGKAEEAEKQFRMSIQAFSDLLGESSVNAQRDSISLAQCLHSQGKSDEASRILLDVVRLSKEAPDSNGRVAVRSFDTVATLLYELRPDKAEEILLSAVKSLRKAEGDESATVRLLRTQATRLLRNKQYDAARLLLEECYDIHRSNGNEAGKRRVQRDLDRLASDPEAFAAEQPPGRRDAAINALSE